jgi:probable addiction module antidote protein
MSTVFIGGSRHVVRLSALVKERLDNIIRCKFMIVVGDAAGADKAVQKYLLDASYSHVTVFCSGDHPRNNIGSWETYKVAVKTQVKGFQFYAAKDREMAKKADYGLMIWDGKSAGTALNVLRLVRAGKKAVLLNVPDKRTVTFKTMPDWIEFLSQCDHGFVEDLRARATPEEWVPVETSQSSLLEALEPSAIVAKPSSPFSKSDDELTAEINAAFASGDLASVVELLGSIAKARGMSQVAKETGLARESLYRSLNSGGNPEFSTVMKVMSSVGLQLSVSKSVGLQDSRQD